MSNVDRPPQTAAEPPASPFDSPSGAAAPPMGQNAGGMDDIERESVSLSHSSSAPRPEDVYAPPRSQNSAHRMHSARFRTTGPGTPSQNHKLTFIIFAVGMLLTIISVVAAFLVHT